MSNSLSSELNKLQSSPGGSQVADKLKAAALKAAEIMELKREGKDHAGLEDALADFQAELEKASKLNSNLLAELSEKTELAILEIVEVILIPQS